MIAVIQHHHDHDVIAHRLNPADRHAAAEFITDYLVPKVAAGWRTASDADLAHEIRRLAAQPDSELTTLLINLVTDEQIRRTRTAVTSC